MQLILDTNSLVVKKRNKSFWIVGKTTERTISPQRVTSIAVTADCLLAASAIRLAAEHAIPIFYFDTTGRLRARLTGPGYGSLATIRRRQVEFAATTAATAWVVDLFVEKLAAQRRVLAAAIRRRPAVAPRLAAVEAEMQRMVAALDGLRDKPLDEARSGLMGHEGQAARLYWKALGECLPAGWDFPGRSRRPARNPFNAALNYLYGMLYGHVEQALVAAGLDPYLGFLHVDQHRKPVLSYDVIEPFRPWVDGLLLRLCWDKKLSPSDHFEIRNKGVYLDKRGKRVVIPALNDFLAEPTAFEGKRIRRRNRLFIFTGRFAQFLRASDPTE